MGTMRRAASLLCLVGALLATVGLLPARAHAGGPVVEVFEASTKGRGWFDLIGSPAHPLIRTVLLIAWVGAPALFVRTRSWESPSAS